MENIFWHTIEPTLIVVIVLIAIALMWRPSFLIYKAFTSREELSIEGTVTGMEDPDPLPIFPTIGSSSYVPECHLDIRDKNGNKFFILLDRPLFLKIKEWMKKKKTIRLKCFKYWNQTIHAESFDPI